MEDDEILVDEFCGDSTAAYFGLYDGHGGRPVVNFVVKALHKNIEHLLRQEPSADIAEVMKIAYLMTDGQVRRANILHSGTTSVSCIVRWEQDPENPARRRRMLYCANVGDSRAILCRNGVAVRMTIDHKPNLPEETKRIEEAGGFIGRCNRVNGLLAISRALGDHMLKPNEVVSAVPYTKEVELTDTDTYLLLACDGVWDVMEDQEAIDFILDKMRDFDRDPSNSQDKEKLNFKLEDVSRALVQLALDKKSLDNITVMVIKL
jgi:protein phosphatase PTC1